VHNDYGILSVFQLNPWPELGGALYLNYGLENVEFINSGLTVVLPIDEIILFIIENY
jgi:hypothetical protein